MSLTENGENHYRYTSNQPKTDMTKTRFRNKIEKIGKIKLIGDWQLGNIDSILNAIRTAVPFINYYSNIENITKGIDIFYDNESLVLTGLNIDLYSFLENPHTITLLQKIKNSKKKITEEDYNQQYKPKVVDQHIKHKTCNICIENFKLNEVYVQTRCGHLFHNNCLKNWLTVSSINNNCPTCRTNLFTVNG